MTLQTSLSPRISPAALRLYLVTDQAVAGSRTVADVVAAAGGAQEGLTNMRCRMEEIDGNFEISTRPGGGTRVGFSAPLADETHPP